MRVLGCLEPALHFLACSRAFVRSHLPLSARHTARCGKGMHVILRLRHHLLQYLHLRENPIQAYSSLHRQIAALLLHDMNLVASFVDSQMGTYQMLRPCVALCSPNYM
jgi:hypothetical protein